MFHFSAACAFAIHLVELIIPFSRLDISTPIHFFFSFLAMKLITVLLVALKIFTANAQEYNRPGTCEDWMVTREDCNTYCNRELANFPDGSWTKGWMKAKGGIGNISGCTCTAWETWEGSTECDTIRGRDGNYYCNPRRIPKNPRPGRQIDMSCSRTPTPRRPMKQPRGRGFCEEQSEPLYTLEDCQDFCVENRRFPRAIMNANGMLVCECLAGQGGRQDWACGTMETTTPSYVRSG